MPEAPQSGSATDILTNDRRTLSAVWRNNKLWVTTQVVPASGANSGQATAYVTQFNASGSGATLDNGTEIGGEDISVGAYTFFPSLTVDASGDAYVGFSISNSDMFCGSYTAQVLGTTAAVSPTLTAQAGVDDYVRTFGGVNRWGDYSNTRLDPSDGTIWTFNKAALAGGNVDGNGHDGQWGVHMVQFNTAEYLPIELLSFDGIAEGNDAILNWTTATELDNKGFEIQQLIEGNYQTIDFVNGAGNSLTEKKYEYKDQELRPGMYYYRLNQIDFSGSENKNANGSCPDKNRR